MIFTELLLTLSAKSDLKLVNFKCNVTPTYFSANYLRKETICRTSNLPLCTSDK